MTQVYAGFDVFTFPIPAGLQTISFGTPLLTLPPLPQKLTSLLSTDVYEYEYKKMCSKFKPQFLKWLWTAREQIAIRKYHPNYLHEHLHENDDLEEVLANWL